ncbi:50S ribosomal protein L25 [Patescibacteria group bacterium]
MQLAGQKREIFGKKTQKLRYENLVPGVIFGKGLESVPISIDLNSFIKLYREVGETSVVDLKVENEKHPVLIKDVQVHPVTSAPIHVGFYEVNLKEKITAEIPLEAKNEELNPLIKSGEAILLVLLNEISVESLPTDLPDNFVIDATKLTEIGDVITIEDLKYDKEKVEIVDIEPDEVLAKLDYAQMLEVEEEEEPVDEADAIAGIEATEEAEETEETEETEQKEE